MEDGVSEDGVRRQFKRIVSGNDFRRGRSHRKVSEEDFWVGYDLILLRLCRIELFLYVKGWLFMKIHVEVSAGSFRGSFRVSFERVVSGEVEGGRHRGRLQGEVPGHTGRRGVLKIRLLFA